MVRIEWRGLDMSLPVAAITYPTMAGVVADHWTSDGAGTVSYPDGSSVRFVAVRHTARLYHVSFYLPDGTDRSYAVTPNGVLQL